MSAQERPRSAQECSGAPRSVREWECPGVFRSVQECSGATGSILESPGMYRSVQSFQEFLGVYRNVQKRPLASGSAWERG